MRNNGYGEEKGGFLSRLVDAMEKIILYLQQQKRRNKTLCWLDFLLLHIRSIGKNATTVPEPNNPDKKLQAPIELDAGKTNETYVFVETSKRVPFTLISDQLELKRIQKKGWK